VAAGLVMCDERRTPLAGNDGSGRLARTLHNGRTGPGAYRGVWNGRDDHSREVAAGICLQTLEQDGDRLGGKVVLAE